MAERIRLGIPPITKKAEVPVKAYDEQKVFDTIHFLLMQTKISHYDTLSFSAHSAFDRTFESLEDLIDRISEQVIGYTGVRPTQLSLGEVKPLKAEDLGNSIINAAVDLQVWASGKKFPNIENLSQELSGVGAQLKYLASLV